MEDYPDVNQTASKPQKALMARLPLISRQPAAKMGQSSSQPATQLAAQPEVNGKPEKRKKSKKRKEKKRADSGGHAQEEEIAQALLEMKGSQALDLGDHEDEDDLAAAKQLLAESSPVRQGTLTKFNSDSVLLREKVKSKRKVKKNSRVRKDRNEELDDGADLYDYVEDLVEGGSHSAGNPADGYRRAQRDQSSSQPVPSLDDIDSNAADIAPYMREYDGQLSIAEPTVSAAHAQDSPGDDATVRIFTPCYGNDHSNDHLMYTGYSLPVHQYQSPTDCTSKRRKRKKQQGNTGSTAEITTSLDQGSVLRNGTTQKISADDRQTNGSISPRHSDTVSAIDTDDVTETINQRNMSPDLYDIPPDSVLPGIEDPTSPSHRRNWKRQQQQRNKAIAVNGDGPQGIHPLYSNGQEPKDHVDSRHEVLEPVNKASLKRKRRLPVVGNHDLGSDRPKKKAKSVDYKTQQVRKASPSQVSNLGAGARKEGPYTDAEIAKLFSFRDEYCQENDLTPEQFNNKVHASAHNNVTNIDFWNEVSDVLPYRTRHSIQRLCRRRFHNFTKRGKWTKEEDEELREAHEQHGNKWKVIGDQIERMPEDCRDRWRNYLKDNEFRNRDIWTEYEVECLREAVAECIAAMRDANEEHKEKEGFGRDPAEQPDQEEKDMINWVIVSAKLGGSRSRLQCSYKWKWLQEDFLRKLKEPDKKLKKVLARGPKKLNAWRAKRAKTKYQFMLPGDKYELLDA